MTAYAARTDLTRFGISEKALTNVSTETQDAALEAASRVADSYLRSRYALPLAGYGDDLGVLTAALLTVAFYVDDEVKAKARHRLVRWFGVAPAHQKED